MTQYIGCETARDLLDAFVDGELSVPDQVMVEAHLRWCTTCSARVEDMSIIGDAVRIGSAAVRERGHVDDRVLTRLQDDVLSRLSAEHDQSFGVRVREMFEDMHLLWPALGACCAVLICLAGAATVLYATSDEHPESLAALIATMSAGSGQQDPLMVDNTVVIPRAIDGGLMLDVPDDEAAVTLATVVSSDGRISDFALLQSEREVVSERHDRTRHQRELADLLHQVKQAQFEPAQALSGRKVAVNVVWQIARITVKGTARAVRSSDVVNAAPVPMPVAVPKREEVKPPAVDDPNGVVSTVDASLPTA
jgi:hypothetical protein